MFHKLEKHNKNIAINKEDERSADNNFILLNNKKMEEKYMTKEYFKNYVRENIKNVLAAHDGRYEDCEIVESTNRKNNGKKYPVLAIKQQDDPYYPVINVERFYMEYEMNGKPLSVLMEEMAMTVINETAPENISVREISDFEKIKDSIVINVVNYDQNREDLELFSRYGEMAVIYRIVKKAGTARMYITITPDMLEMWGKTKKEIHDLALSNTERLFPVKEKPLGAAVLEMEMQNLDSLEIPEIVKEQIREEMMRQKEELDTGMIILSNEENNHGASVLFYKGLLNRLSERYETSYFIIPSSVHELMLYPDDGTVAEYQLKALLTEANNRSVPKEDWLSDNLYYYNRNKQKLQMVRI